MADVTCTQCQGTTWVVVDSQGRKLARRCRCFLDNRANILLSQANIPTRYAECSFENFDVMNDSLRDALKIAKKFVTNFPAQDIGLLFQGPCGVGKTHLAVAILNQLIREKNAPAYFCDFRELIRNLQNSYSSDSAMTESDVIGPIFEKKVLVLDELGAKRTSPWVEETIFYIINHRYNNRKLTIFTSNFLDKGEEEEDTRDPYYKKDGLTGKFKDESLVDRIGERLRSRIYEMCKIVHIGGKDYRIHAKQAGYRF
jgi:DNA replication protein DnaC